MADVKETLLFEELLSRYRKKKKALCFHLGIKQKHIARTRVTEDVELVVVINTGRQTSSKDLAQALACQQGEKNWRRYLKVFSRSAWVEKGIRGNLADAQQTWAQGKAILESDPDHAVQLMQNAIALLESGLKRCATAAAKNLKEQHKLNSAFGGKRKAARFNGIKEEVIKLLEARPGGWKTKTDAISDLIKDLRPYIEEHGWPSVQDEDDSLDKAEIEGRLGDLLREWSVPSGDKCVSAAFAKAVRKR